MALALYHATPSASVLVRVNFISSLSRSFLSTAMSFRNGASSSRRQLLRVRKRSVKRCDGFVGRSDAGKNLYRVLWAEMVAEALSSEVIGTKLP